jgi:hypothetical protein
MLKAETTPFIGFASEAAGRLKANMRQAGGAL